MVTSEPKALTLSLCRIFLFCSDDVRHSFSYVDINVNTQRNCTVILRNCVHCLLKLWHGYCMEHKEHVEIHSINASDRHDKIDRLSMIVIASFLSYIYSPSSIHTNKLTDWRRVTPLSISEAGESWSSYQLMAWVTGVSGSVSYCGPSHHHYAIGRIHHVRTYSCS